jgi:hypothetical protein
MSGRTSVLNIVLIEKKFGRNWKKLAHKTPRRFP